MTYDPDKHEKEVTIKKSVFFKKQENSIKKHSEICIHIRSGHYVIMAGVKAAQFICVNKNRLRINKKRNEEKGIKGLSEWCNIEAAKQCKYNMKVITK